MKLLWSSRSPFARKVMVAAHELGVAEHIELERVVVATDVVNATVMASNPLSQIPTLIRDDGVALFDSSVIIEYLNAVHKGRLLPPAGEPRWAALAFEALGDGLAQLNRGRLAEGRRGDQASPNYQLAFAVKTAAVLDQLNLKPPIGPEIDVGGIAIGVALAHLDFRFPEMKWRDGRGRLTDWFDTIDQRPSMRATKPEDVY